MGGDFPKLGKLLGHEEEHAEVLSATSGSCMEIKKQKQKKNMAGVAFSEKEQWRAARREGFKLLIANFVASTRHLVKNICKANRST